MGKVFNHVYNYFNVVPRNTAKFEDHPLYIQNCDCQKEMHFAMEISDWPGENQDLQS